MRPYFTPLGSHRVVAILTAVFWFAAPESYGAIRKLEVSAHSEANQPLLAEVKINGRIVGVTPHTDSKFKIESNDKLEINVELKGYTNRTPAIILHDSIRKTKSSDPIVLKFTMVEIRREVEASITVMGADGAALANAVVTEEGRRIQNPLKTTLAFERRSADDLWPTLKVRAENPPNYYREEIPVSSESAKKGSPLALKLTLGVIRKVVPGIIRANQLGATVSSNGVVIGTTADAPLQTDFLFNRADPTAPWPVIEIQISKEGFEHDLGSTNPQPVFVDRVYATNSVKTIVADHFKPVTLVSTPIRLIEIRADGSRPIDTNALSAVNSSDTKRPEFVMQVDPERPFSLSRISVMPEALDKIAFSWPVYESRSSGASPTSPLGTIVGANIYLRDGVSLRPLTTEPRTFDTDPFLTKDFLYYSSDRGGNRKIWQKPIDGAGLRPITGNKMTSIDTEPSVSPDGFRVAWVSRDPNAPPNALSKIWISKDAEGGGAAEYWPGRSPSWSPDGKQIAFVRGDNILAIADPNSSSAPREFPIAAATLIASPVWKPNGKEILFASNRGLNERKLPNWDIWSINIEDETSKQITIDGSLDAAPAVAGDGTGATVLYFFSNRGAQKSGQEKLQIYKLNPD